MQFTNGSVSSSVREGGTAPEEKVVMLEPYS
jgi:hypothetical protein